MAWPCAARNVKHIPPPISNWSTMPTRVSITPSLSLTLAPPSTATNGRLGLLRKPLSTETSCSINRPAAERSVRGGPTIEPWARWAAPNASLTYKSTPCTRCSTNSAPLPSSPGENRKFSRSSTPGANSASRARTGAMEYLGFAVPLGRPR